MACLVGRRYHGLCSSLRCKDYLFRDSLGRRRGRPTANNSSPARALICTWPSAMGPTFANYCPCKELPGVPDFRPTAPASDSSRRTPSTVPLLCGRGELTVRDCDPCSPAGTIRPRSVVASGHTTGPTTFFKAAMRLEPTFGPCPIRAVASAGKTARRFNLPPVL